MIETNKDTNTVFLYVYLERDNFENWSTHVENFNPKGQFLYAENGKNHPDLIELSLDAVPRFILVDSNGRIANYNALHPSDGLKRQLEETFGAP